MTPVSRANEAKARLHRVEAADQDGVHFRGAKRDFWATSMLSSRWKNDLVLVMRSNRAGSSESRLILMRRRPAAMSRRSVRPAGGRGGHGEVFDAQGVETRECSLPRLRGRVLAAGDANLRMPS